MGNGPTVSKITDRLPNNRSRTRISVSESSKLSSTPTTLPPPSPPPATRTSLPKPRISEDAQHQEISERDVAFLCTQTDLPPDQIVRLHKKFFRDNPGGRLDLEGFRRFYCILRNEPIERLGSMCEHIFRAFDIDGNGHVEFSEFLLGFAICSKGDLKQRLNYAFECYDINSNGYLTQDEIELVIQSMCTFQGIKHVQDYPPELMAKDLMKRLDPSNSGRVSRDEFITILAKDAAYRNMMNPFH